MTVATIFDLNEFKPLAPRWRRRQETFTARRSLYDGTYYSLKGLRRLKWMQHRFYKGIKPLYLPLSRAVDVDAGIVPAEWAFDEEEPKARRWEQARDLLWSWSKWKTRGVLYVHYGAMLGVSGLKVADLRSQQRVVVAPVDPATFMLVHESMYDDAPGMALVVEKREDTAGKEFEYAEVITPEAVRTFKNGEPTGFDGREPEYRNDLGFVPFVETKHIDAGGELGEATFVKAAPLLGEVNELASYLADIVKKHAEPQWAVFGAEASDLVKSGDNVWFFSDPNAKVMPIVAGVDIAGILEFIREIAGNVEKALPETAFDELRRKDQIATATLELQLMELVLKIKRVRPNYDDGLVSGLRMAGLAAQSMGVSDEGIPDLADEDLTLNNERPVLPLDPETAMRIEMQAIALEREKAMGSAEGMMDARPETGEDLRAGADRSGEPVQQGRGERDAQGAPVPA